ncbi:MAG: Hsp20/alpha crystallin family protein [Chloroflexota bacterium]
MAWAQLLRVRTGGIGITMDKEQIGLPRDSMMRAVEHLFLEKDASGKHLASRHPNVWSPPTDLYEAEDAYYVRIEIAGMREGYLSVTVDDRHLAVSGVRHDSDPKGAYHKMEIRYGNFRTVVHLPGTVDEEKVEASYDDGFLTISLPKPKPHNVRIVPVDTGNKET